MRMIDLAGGGSSQRGTLRHINNNKNNKKNRRIIDTTTSVDCVRDQVSFRRSSFRCLVGCMVPYCCGFSNFQSSSSDASSSSDSSTSLSSSSSSSDTDSTTRSSSTTTTVTGTFFGYRKGRVSFCLQEDSRSTPLVLFEFAVQTAYLAKEMQHGQLRIALECEEDSSYYYSCSLYKVPAWSMYCNGRKVGYAMRRQMTVSDLAVLKLMQSVSVGAGVLPTNITQQPQPHQAHHGEDLLYLRASFQRVIGSVHSHSFHMINPAGSSAQDLSIFLLRSS